MGIEILKQKLAEAVKDEFLNGTVIRWTMNGTYLFAAIKTSSGWYATSYNDTAWVPRRMSFEQLLDVLSRSEATHIAIANSWTMLLRWEITADGVTIKPDKSDEIWVLTLVDTGDNIGWFSSLKKAKKYAKRTDGVPKSAWEVDDCDPNCWNAVTDDNAELCISKVSKGED